MKRIFRFVMNLFRLIFSRRKIDCDSHEMSDGLKRIHSHHHIIRKTVRVIKDLYTDDPDTDNQKTDSNYANNINNKEEFKANENDVK